MKLSNIGMIILLILLFIIASMIILYSDQAEGQRIEPEAAGSTWKWNVDPTCGFSGTAKITTNSIITGNILVYTAIIQAGSCELTTDIRYIMGVTTTNQRTIDTLIDNDLDAWANEVGTVTINNPQPIRRPSKGNSTRS